MNLLLNLVLRFYPIWWRERYGDEFNALLDEVRPGIGGVLDILKGALAMQLSTHGNYIRTIGLTTAIGLVVVLIFGLTMEHQFRSTATVTVQTQMAENTTLQDTAESLHRMVGSRSQVEPPFRKLLTIMQQVTSRDSLSQIADNHNLYPGLDSAKRLEQMKKGIEIQVASNKNKQDRTSSAFTISFVYPDRTVVNKVVNELTAQFINSNIEQGRLAVGEGLAPKGAKFKVVDPARMPDAPIQPAWGKMLTMGFLGGLGLGFIVLFFRRLTRRAKLPPNEPSITTES